ncbi:MAG: alpha/beta fold hydrolase [Deltaproteobacteria bacterium]|jgi:predicted dienelactone hydrolase|nr:alpha/beta fold hydrolase [Deltaproteobacteria bacterium]MBW2529869.1 alpha/beta fold hydrolase [Deltaproteobacteria bacterium]
MSYAPADRGPFPVGVQSIKLRDRRREGRLLVTEIWYPADEQHRGQDLARATNDLYELLPGVPGLAASRQQAVRDADPTEPQGPLVVFSHGFGSHRRQSTYLCTHLASHGYIVAAPDHLGNTARDVGQLVMGAMGAGRVPRLYEAMPAVVQARPEDLLAVARELPQANESKIALPDESSPLGIVGHSFGGWTALVAAARSTRVGACVALAPAGGRSTIPGRGLRQIVERECSRSVPTLIVAGERDALLPLDGVRDLVALLPEPKRLQVLARADHMHFCDYPKATHEMMRKLLARPVAAPIADMLLSDGLAPFSDLLDGEQALAAVRAITLAHLDATLRQSQAAARYLVSELPHALLS